MWHQKEKQQDINFTKICIYYGERSKFKKKKKCNTTEKTGYAVGNIKSIFNLN